MRLQSILIKFVIEMVVFGAIIYILTRVLYRCSIQ